jgi:hypothetical protein
VFIYAGTDRDKLYRYTNYTKNFEVPLEKGLHPRLFFVLNEPEENLCNTPSLYIEMPWYQQSFDL